VHNPLHERLTTHVRSPRKARIWVETKGLEPSTPALQRRPAMAAPVIFAALCFGSSGVRLPRTSSVATSSMHEPLHVRRAAAVAATQGRLATSVGGQGCLSWATAVAAAAAAAARVPISGGNWRARRRMHVRLCAPKCSRLARSRRAALAWRNTSSATPTLNADSACITRSALMPTRQGRFRSTTHTAPRPPDRLQRRPPGSGFRSRSAPRSPNPTAPAEATSRADVAGVCCPRSLPARYRAARL